MYSFPILLLNYTLWNMEWWGFCWRGVQSPKCVLKIRMISILPLFDCMFLAFAPLHHIGLYHNPFSSLYHSRINASWDLYPLLLRRNIYTIRSASSPSPKSFVSENTHWIGNEWYHHPAPHKSSLPVDTFQLLWWVPYSFHLHTGRGNLGMLPLPPWWNHVRSHRGWHQLYAVRFLFERGVESKHLPAWGARHPRGTVQQRISFSPAVK